MNGLPLRYFGAVLAKLLIEMVTVRARNVFVCECMGKDRSVNTLKTLKIMRKVAAFHTKRIDGTDLGS